VTSQGDFPVTVPDLGSPAVARASAEAGVTQAELARLRRAQQCGAPNSTLDRLDTQITRRAAARRAAARSTARREAAAPR
jgi:hypothetical protein